MAGTAQGDCAAREPHGHLVPPGNYDVVRRSFPKTLQAAAASFGVESILAPVNDSSELQAVIAAQAREPNGGLVAMPDSFLTAHRVEVTSLAARYRLPALYTYRSFTEVGGLMSYGNDPLVNYRRSATYVDRILKGKKPNELCGRPHRLKINSLATSVT
jgi:putative tryptophan/tyrosine transport system substrate-binding protein